MTSPHRPRVVVIGGGMGGLAGAVELAARGWHVSLFDAGPALGGKMRQVAVGESLIDAGPTVLTLRDVFEGIFARAGTQLDRHVTLEPMHVLARHAWQDGSTLDLHADLDASAQAIAAFSGPDEAEGFRRFLRHAQQIWQTVEGPFVRSQRPSPLSILRDHGFGAMPMLAKIDSHRPFWSALSHYFQDPRLRQLFGRYATYTGCSPFLAPATLSLIAWVEAAGVWRVAGGMQALARALEDVLRGLGGEIHVNTPVAEILVRHGHATGVRLKDGAEVSGDCVLFAGDISALGSGALGDAVRAVAAPTRPQMRSLSALTWCIEANTSGFDLAHHNVFFGNAYAREFQDIFQTGQLPRDPTVYVCAQDRGDVSDKPATERLFVLVNAPARADVQPLQPSDLAACQEETFGQLAKMGLTMEATVPPVRTSPSEFAARYPGSGGALYGAVNHSWTASLDRPSATTRIRGLYVAGGTTHPGAGVPMAALSGVLAAQAISANCRSLFAVREVA